MDIDAILSLLDKNLEDPRQFCTAGVQVDVFDYAVVCSAQRDCLSSGCSSRGGHQVENRNEVVVSKAREFNR